MNVDRLIAFLTYLAVVVAVLAGGATIYELWTR